MENARSKALAYYQVFQQPLFSCDSGLYFKGLPEECQPGVHVRRRQGKRLNDDEMTAWYAHLANTYGTITAYYVNAICYIKDAEHIYESDDVSLWSQPFHIVSTPHEKKVSGFPLDRISKNVQTGLYFYDQEQELNELEAIGIRSFFKKHIIL